MEEVVGSRTEDLLSSDEAARVRADDRLVMEREDPIGRIDQIETVDGDQRVVETLKAPLRDGDETLAVIGATPLGIALSTLDGSRFVEVNEGFEELRGYRRDELVGKRALELDIRVNPADRRRLARRGRGGGEVRSMGARLACKNGEVIEAEISADALEIGGQAYLLAVTRDVTD